MLFYFTNLLYLIVISKHKSDDDIEWNEPISPVETMVTYLINENFAQILDYDRKRVTLVKKKNS